MFVVAALAACAPEVPEVPGLPPGLEDARVDLDVGSGTLAWRALEHLDDAVIALPDAGDAPVSDGTFPLNGPWEATGQGYGRLHLYTHPLPFHTDMPRPNYAPFGARLFRGERLVPYVNDAGDLQAGGWFVEDDTVRLFALQSPATWPETPTIRAPELVEAARRRRWDPAAGVSPADFLRTEVTVGRITRPGIHLPAGASVTFTVQVPPGATLDWGLGPLPDPLGGGAAEGGAVARVLVDGASVAEDEVAPDAAIVDRAASLATWGGRTVAVELRAEPTAAGGHGHVVFTVPTIRRPPEGEVRRVVVVGIDTLRRDALGVHGAAADRTPELDAWARQFVVFDQAWAPAPRTRPSFRSAVTGRWPLAAGDAPTLAQHLAPLGFRTAGVVANVHLVPRFGFNDGFEHWAYENGARGADQVDRALAWLDAHRDEDTFLFLHLMDPHTFYNAPEPYGSRFQEGTRPPLVPEVFDRWHIYQAMRKKAWGDEEKAWVRGAYEGEVAYLSAELSRFLKGLDAMGGRTLTVVHSDHGEELWDHGAYEHNHTLYDELVRAMLWVRTPRGWAGGPHRVDAPVSLVDIVPTILDVVGGPAPTTDGRSLRALFDPARATVRDAVAAELKARPLQLGHLMFDTERWGVVAEGAKYVLHTGSGEEELYDLAADPREQADLAPRADAARLDRMRAALEKSTGFPVRAGWRLRLGRPVSFRVRWDAEVATVGVVDPEAERETRSNLEWGESPPVSVDDVGRFVLDAAGTSATFTPGPKAAGRQLYVACAGPCPAGTVTSAAASVPLAEGTVSIGTLRLEARRGTVIAVAPPERVAAPAEAAQIEALEELGYLDGEE